MTSVAAKIHAEALLAHERAVNVSYIADPGLERHAETAKIVIDLCGQLDAALAELDALKASKGRSAA